ncbi:uncharacterized protein [Clytia hemisphaerica]|uniref:uncharacterized protein n=1 Tax=Clytia hemisphaerica TaxID=252671 RepID=UPI0034D491AA
MGSKLKLAFEAMKILKDEVHGIQKSQGFLNDKFDNQTKEIKNIQTKLKNISIENKTKEQQLDQLKERLRKHEEKMKQNENKMNELEQYGRRQMLNIFGVPRRNDEDTDEIVLNIASQLGFDLYREDIEVSHRTSSRQNAPIIVKFNSRRVRDLLYDARWDLKHFSTKDVGFDVSEQIFFNESLTETNRDIFKEAWRALKKSGLYEKVITVNGVTYAWKKYSRNSKSEKQIVLSKSDIIRLAAN